MLVAACASKTGASALILGYCRQRKLQGSVSLDVIGEARKNVNFKLGPNGRKRLVYFLKMANLKAVSNPSIEKIASCEKVINRKDSPILAAALKSPAKFLLTLDRKDFLKPKVFQFAKPLKILTPGEFVLKYFKIARKEKDVLFSKTSRQYYSGSYSRQAFCRCYFLYTDNHFL